MSVFPIYYVNFKSFSKHDHIKECSGKDKGGSKFSPVMQVQYREHSQ